jgi:hypothetical protein
MKGVIFGDLINQRQKINIMALPNVKWRKANP